ncbi:phage tail assembly chaperone [Salsuginibacillus kocurii]|uniref:phage tail assembly chaperone n=1 Tax=Salsuginibacillus kocurii TaxID=427078 RepID=UPI0003672BE7|nr:hypothetical protein [Salsuginibacillus kocurii]
MTEQQYKNLTVKALLERKDEIKDKQRQQSTLYIKSLDATIKVQEPANADILDAMEMKDGGADEFLIYNNVVEPNLKSADLQKGYGVQEPEQIVKELFKKAETHMIAQHMMELAGYSKGSVKAVDETKN